MQTCVTSSIYTNHNVTILDGAKVSFGDNVFIAPDWIFSIAGHPCRVIRKITEEDKKKYPI